MMSLKNPSAPFEPVYVHGESITIDVSGSMLIIPTGHLYALLYQNQYTLISGRTLPAAGTYTFTDDQDNDTGLQNMIYPWIAYFNSTGVEIDFFLFTHRPKNFSYTVSNNKITQLVLYPGNGLIYHGRITHSNLTIDSNSDMIPDCLDATKPGSLTRFLQSYIFVEPVEETVIQTKQFLTADGKTFLTADGKNFLVSA